jgi:ribosomal protein S18 acetylase RimI-like enzyme
MVELASFTEEYIANIIKEQEVHVAYLDDIQIGCFSIQFSGLGLGNKLLDWAEKYIRDCGKSFFRLDCMADNEELNTFYIRAGFNYRGRVDGKGWSANLYEKELG